MRAYSLGSDGAAQQRLRTLSPRRPQQQTTTNRRRRRETRRRAAQHHTGGREAAKEHRWQRGKDEMSGGEAGRRDDSASSSAEVIYAIVQASAPLPGVGVNGALTTSADVERETNTATKPYACSE